MKRTAACLLIAALRLGLAADGMYPAAWSIGEGGPCANADGGAGELLARFLDSCHYAIS